MHKDVILPDSIAIQPDIAAFDLSVKKVLDGIPVEKVLVYNIDQVDSRALTALATQFDVLGYKGMRLAHNEMEQRAIIKKSIELHRYKGTPWAVKEAMKAVGFADAEIMEHVIGPEPQWANFSINLLNEGVGITTQTIADLRKMIDEYKNVRSRLIDVTMEILINETVDLSDDQAEYVEDFISDDQMVMSNKLFYDGQGDYDGLFDHSGDNDVVEWLQL